MSIDTKKLRELAEAATPNGEFGPYTNRHMQVSVPLEDLIALLDETDSLERTAQRRLQDMAHLSEQLTAMTRARDELADVAVMTLNHLDRNADAKAARIAELRKVGQ